jgi:hypothetical protein
VATAVEEERVSNRKQAHRRRAYGRRQHEIHERRERGETWSIDGIGASDAEVQPERSHDVARVDMGGTASGGGAVGFGVTHAELLWEQSA